MEELGSKLCLEGEIRKLHFASNMISYLSGSCLHDSLSFFFFFCFVSSVSFLQKQCSCLFSKFAFSIFLWQNCACRSYFSRDALLRKWLWNYEKASISYMVCILAFQCDHWWLGISVESVHISGALLQKLITGIICMVVVTCRGELHTAIEHFVRKEWPSVVSEVTSSLAFTPELFSLICQFCRVPEKLSPFCIISIIECM